jgi:hypothetical protein
MPAMLTAPLPMTLGAVAKRYGLPVWKIRRLYELKQLPEPRRIGFYRIDLPQIEEALRRMGYISGGDHAA